IELLDCQPDQVVNVGAGVSPYFCPLDGTDDQLWRFHLGGLEGRPYVLTVGGSEARKGTERLIAAVGQLVDRSWDVHLVVVGDLTEAWRQRLTDAAQAARLGDRLLMTGAVDDELLRACYRRAAVTVTPSLAEGSGLPILESAASGTPALTSATTALVEVAATPLATFDPTDAGAIADSIARLLADDQRREEVLAAQQQLASVSTWEAVAARAIGALDELEGCPPASSAVRGWQRPKVALVGPLPPAGGGIGAYNLHLLDRLPRIADVDAVTTGLTFPDVPASVPHVPAAAFGHEARGASYDAVVYALGNSAGHLPTVELALREPGWLWLHEVRLPAIATTALADVDDDVFAERLARYLRRAYPGRAPLGAARRAGRSNLDLVAAGVGLIGPLAERCRGILVNSQLARRLVLLDLTPLAAHPPVHVLPPGCPPARSRPTGALIQGDPLVTAFGVVSMSKQPNLLVDAAARVGCRLAFVGPCPSILAEVIRDRARLRGVAERVEVTGEVDSAAWEAWLDRTALAVQLRDATSGETSAAVLDALASGVPVLTNMGAAVEYPEGTVARRVGYDAATLASEIGSLLGSEGALAELSAAGQAFAAAHTFDRLSEALCSVVFP
ncbi:MAG TPA: glycosyltransferase, partial [Acidimicrobiales bacterium]